MHQLQFCTVNWSVSSKTKTCSIRCVKEGEKNNHMKCLPVVFDYILQKLSRRNIRAMNKSKKQAKVKTLIDFYVTQQFLKLCLDQWPKYASSKRLTRGSKRRLNYTLSTRNPIGFITLLFMPLTTLYIKHVELNYRVQTTCIALKQYLSAAPLSLKLKPPFS